MVYGVTENVDDSKMFIVDHSYNRFIGLWVTKGSKDSLQIH